MQLTLDGRNECAPIEFDCPICQKHFALKTDHKHIYHRPWAFHVAIDHGDWLLQHAPKEDVALWVEYFVFFDTALGAELRSRLTKEEGR